MAKPNEPSKKCFCARCFLPVDGDDKVDIEGQNFHRLCSTCCICRTIPTSLKMFYGHVFCGDCFKSHVASRFRGEPRLHSNSWWMQWAPGARQETTPESGMDNDPKGTPKPEESCKRYICARCLQVVNDDCNKVEIGGQNFHPQCARCCFCRDVPKNSAKIYYGQVFCEECFHRHVLNRNRDNPSDFFKNCFEQWQSNAQFAESMREFMTGSKDAAPPLVFMMNGGHVPFCRCGTTAQEHVQSNETNSAMPTLLVGDDSTSTWSLFENRPMSPSANLDESATQYSNTAAAEKIEKLTKYQHDPMNNLGTDKKWKNYEGPSLHGWVDLQDPKIDVDSSRCLWQRGTVFINGDCL